MAPIALCYPNIEIAVLVDRKGMATHCPNQPQFRKGWIDFFWEVDENVGVGANITRLIQFIGDDPKRPGLLETPGRVVKSFTELYSGYSDDVKNHFKIFEEKASDEIILLKDIEFYSTCEHHMQPFVGKAHIAYIPNEKGEVIGISKLARILEVYARRLQIQERICTQVTTALMENLKPQAAACVIEAKHFCMCARGVNKQNSIMTTSSMVGLFRDNPTARFELMSMISL